MAQLSLWMNPAMPYRHLHPRAAGSMVFKGGGSTTNVTNTGLGDDQYKAIMNNLATNFDSADVRYEEVRPLLDNMGVDTDQLLTDLTSLSSAQSTGFTNIQDLLGQYDLANQGRTDTITQNQGTTQSQIGQLSTDVGTGFGNVQGGITDLGTDMSNRFDTVDQTNANLQNAVNTGFEDQQTGFSDLEGRMIQDRAAQDTSFGEVGTQLTNLGTGQDTMMANQGDLAEGQTGLAGRINDLSSDVDGVGANLDTYYSGLADGQNRMENNQAEFKTSFDDYVDRYGDDTSLANQKRLDIQDQIVGGVQGIRNDIGVNANTTNTNIGNLADATGSGFENTNQAIAGGFQDSTNQYGEQGKAINNSFTSLNDVIGQGFQNTNSAISGGFQNAANEYNEQGTMIRNGFATQVDNIAKVAQGIQGLDKNMVGNFGLMSDAFDETGELVQSSINADGTIMQRSIGPNGSLRMDRYTNQGQYLETRALSIPETLGQMLNLQQTGLMAAQ